MFLWYFLYYTLPLPLLYSNFSPAMPFSFIFFRSFRLPRSFINCLHKKSKKVKFAY